MMKLVKSFGIIFAVGLLLFLCTLIKDKQALRNDVVRMHVVANSDSQEDQKNKHLVKDAVTAYLYDDIALIRDAKTAKNYLISKLTALEAVANETLVNAGSAHRAKVSLAQECFGIREYDTFSLPSGVYESLRIEIGNAEGKNWWCVVFPTLCLPATQEGFSDTAVSAGFHPGLVNTLSEKKGYLIRFFFLDCLGMIENFFSFS